MENYRVQLSRRAAGNLRKLDRKNRLRVAKILLILPKQPQLGKKLTGDLRGLRSVRVWPYRIIYRLFKKYLLILIINIGHRRNIYR
jgi:mRNA interferase RelE/StbE